MKELLLKYPEFTVSTPTGTNRAINFSEPFKDDEFKSWETGFHKNIPTLFLTTVDNKLLRFKYFRGKLEANDPRGGVSVLNPGTNAVPHWEAWIKKPSGEKFVARVENTIDVKRIHSAALIGGEPTEGVDYYNYLDKDPTLVIDAMFSSGYSKVYYMNYKVANKKSAFPLLVNMSELIGSNAPSGSKIGAVQLVGVFDNLEWDQSSESWVSPEADGSRLLDYPNGEWHNFAITSEVWTQIRKKMLESKTNFQSRMTEVFKEARLVRLTPEMSRDINFTPQDARRKNFIVEA